MSTAMYDAREALIPGSAYDRSNAGIYLLFIFVVSHGMTQDNNQWQTLLPTGCIYNPEKKRLA